MKGPLVLQARNEPGLRLRSVASSDAERLRLWKNANRQYFFFKSEISPEAQLSWIEGYLERAHDYVFVVEQDGAPVGCMGFRLLDGKVDVYNVILGVPSQGGRGIMSAGLRMMLGLARSQSPEVELKVLKDNPALRFYERNGFIKMADRGDYLEMKLDWSRFSPVEVT